jgi:hypothetical protein
MRPILLVPSTSQASGVVTHVAETCAVLRLRCACLVEAGSDLDAALPAQCARVTTESGRRGMIRALRQHGGEFGYVETHGARAILAARAARLPSARLGHFFHEPVENEGLRGLLQLQLARGLRVAANAPVTAASVRSRIGGPVEIIPPMVRSEELLPRKDAAKILDLHGTELRVGVVGRLALVKAPVLALEAAALLGQRTRVIYVGDGPERTRILRRARELRLAVLLAGSRGAAERLLNAFDVVACPSPNESFGLTMAHAAAAGVPLAAVDSPGARYVFGEFRDALSAPTAAALATALDRATRLSQESRARLRASVVKRFGSEHSRERTCAFYERRVMAA